MSLHLARNPQTPPHILEELSHDPIADVRQLVGIHARTPPEVLAHLAQDPAWEVRLLLVRNPNLPLKWLEALGGPGTTDAAICEHAATNPAAPTAWLAHWVAINQRPVRGVAANIAAPAHLLEQLSTHQDSIVRAHVAENPATPLATVLRMANSDDIDMVRCAVRNPQLTSAQLAEIDRKEQALDRRKGVYTVDASLAGHPNTPVAILERIAEEYWDKDVRGWQEMLALATNPSSPGSVLLKCLKMGMDRVNYPTLENPGFPLERLVDILQSNIENTEVLASVVRNPSTPEKLRLSVLERMAHSSDWGARAFCAGQLETPTRLLLDLARDERYHVRKHTAYNPNTPQKLRKELQAQLDDDAHEED